MKCYYYKDPLAAAWMQEHFGMRFTNKEGAEILYSHDLIGNKKRYSAWEFLNDADTGYIGVNYYIYPDSEHLLELQVRDLIAEQDNAYSTLIEDKFSCENIIYHFKQNNMKIIQRNGIAMWPESEEV